MQLAVGYQTHERHGYNALSNLSFLSLSLHLSLTFSISLSSIPFISFFAFIVDVLGMPPAALLESCQAKARGQVSIIFVWHDIYLHSAICCHASLRGSVPFIANCSCSIIILKCVTCTSCILQSHLSLSLSLSLKHTHTLYLSLCASIIV